MKNVPLENATDAPLFKLCNRERVQYTLSTSNTATSTTHGSTNGLPWRPMVTISEHFEAVHDMGAAGEEYENS